MKKTGLFFLFLFSLSFRLAAQGTLSGDLQLNANFYNGDSAISAGNTLFYDKYKSGGEGWLALRYNYKGFTAYLRVDAFQNSALYVPTQPLTGFGIGAFTLSKQIGELTITGGYIYDQIGSGILFRAYEDRGLLIDNALVGLHLKYKPTENITLKAFTGQQKNVATFGRYDPIIKGFNAEGDFSAGTKVHFSPGIGVVNRTIDQASMDAVTSFINSYPLELRFIPRYNTYAFTAYNTLTVGNFSWYAEGAYKTHEAESINDNIKDNLRDLPGNVEYTTIGYAKKGIAVNLTAKRTENFVMRTSPKEIQLRGVINWQPVVARLRPQRLMSRYTPASQDISELATGADVLISPKENFDITLNYTRINTLEDIKLYRELYAEAEYRGLKKWIITGGVQYLQYNQELYQIKAQAPIVEAITPFAEITYRISDKQSLRAEVEYQHTEQDFGSWAFALLEYNIAPRWSFSVSDMYNINPNTENVKDGAKHYYNIFTAYTKGPHRFTIGYVKQVEGINCTGGVCRYEPAFSGVRVGVTSSF